KSVTSHIYMLHAILPNIVYKIKYFTIILFLSTIISCGQKEIKTPTNSENMFENFISKDKFKEETAIFYHGLSDEKLKLFLTVLINKVEEEYQKIAYEGNDTEEEYQDAI